MKLKRIISVIFILLILFTNSLVAFAEETEEDDYQTVDINEQDASETDVATTNYIDVDASNYNGYVKPSTGVYDDANGYLYQDEYFASYYFKGLENNFGYNTHGSCGYVAAAMMLSYYDTYLDDNIISEQYDKEGFINSSLDLSNTNNESPGIEREVNSLCPTNSGVSKLKDLDSENYWKVVENHWRIYFHLYLIKLAEEEFNMYHDTLGVLEEGGIQVPIDSDNPCASAMLHQKSLIEYYLYDVKNYTSSDVSLEYTNTDVRNFAINKIKNGQPVMLLLGGTTGFHFVIAYDLDDKGTADNSDDDIYAHYGWYDDTVHINIDTDEFDLLVSAMAINFNVEHSHAYNYKDSLGKTYCSCYFPVHPEHVHSYTSYDSLSHKYSCGCVASYPASIGHNFNYSDIDVNSHSKSCLDCGYLSTEAHNYQPYKTCYEKCSDCDYIHQIKDHDYTHRYESIDNGSHYSYCECGSRTTSSHSFTTSGALDICTSCKLEKNHVHSYSYLSCRDGATHRATCRCGSSSIEQCFGMVESGNLRRCTKCNQILKGGSIVPFGENEDDDVLFFKDDEETE